MDKTSGTFVLVPMDHGVSAGPMEGIGNPAETVSSVARGGATGVIVHKGIVDVVAPSLGNAGLFVHLSASTSLNPDPNDKRLVCSVPEAVAGGADGISVHVNVGAPTESRMLEDLGRVSRESHDLGLPLLAMMYPRGPAVKDPHDVGLVKHVARLGAELGADVLKVPYTGSVDSFKEVVRGCTRPVVLSGGAKMDSDEAVLQMVADSIEAGGRGVSIGRNIWQHTHPELMCRAIAEICRGESDLKGAMKILKG